MVKGKSDAAFMYTVFSARGKMPLPIRGVNYHGS